MFASLSAFIDAHSATIGLVLLAALLAAFLVERFPPVVVAVAGVAVLLVLGLLPPREALAVFANPAPIAIAALFVLSGALVRTGAIEAVVAALTRRAEARPRRALGELYAGTLASAAVVNNTPVVIILAPVIRRLARTVGTAATRLLIPLSYIAILGGMLTLIGTSTNLLVDGVAQEMGQPAFGIFEISGVGLIAASGGVVTLLLLAPRLLPHRRDRDPGQDEGHDALSELLLVPASRAIGRTVGENPALQPPRVRVIALARDGQLRRDALDSVLLRAGDRLVVAASPQELAGLAAGEDFQVGMGGLRGGDLSLRRRPLDVSLFEAAIAPSHPGIGRRLAEIPMLSRLPIRILGISRERHLPGPDLRDARLRAADRLLIAAGPEEHRALREHVHLVGLARATARPYRRGKAPIAIAALAGTILAAALGLLPIAAAGIIAVAVILLARCIDAEEAWSSIDGNVLVLIFGMLAVGAGLRHAGSVDLIVDWALPWLAGQPLIVILAALYLLTWLLTEAVTNNAVAVIMTPVAIGLAEQLGMDPRPLLVTVMFAASASFATPVGYQTNTIVYAAADYRFTDFLKIGVPMNLVVGLCACAGIYWLF